MQQHALNKKTGLAILAVLSLCLTLWVVFSHVHDGDGPERPVVCDAGGYFSIKNLRLFIAPEFMQDVYANGQQKPSASGNSYTCADVTIKNPLPLKNLRFFPEAYLNKNILLDDTPYKTILPITVRPVPLDMRGKAGDFSCNDIGQCIAVVVKDDVFFMLELSDGFFASALQKDIFYASFKRFIEDMIVDPVTERTE